jgi:hypothetical protein
MTAERAAALVRRWVALYTRRLPASVARRRSAELAADLHDHIELERALGTPEHRLAMTVLSRMVRGIPADLAWRAEQTRAQRHPGGAMPTDPTRHRLAVAATIGALLFLAWGVAAMGIVGAEGDPFDLLYLGLAGVGILAAGLARFRPGPMVRILAGLAAAHVVLAGLALVLGKHTSPVSSIPEILGVNGLYVALFLGAAWLFRRSDGQTGRVAGADDQR